MTFCQIPDSEARTTAMHPFDFVMIRLAVFAFLVSKHCETARCREAQLRGWLASADQSQATVNWQASTTWQSFVFVFVLNRLVATSARMKWNKHKHTLFAARPQNRNKTPGRARLEPERYQLIAWLAKHLPLKRATQAAAVAVAVLERCAEWGDGIVYIGWREIAN